MDRIDKAVNYFKSGYGCAQAVITAVSDLIKTDAETLSNAAAAFGGGFARLRGNCGAVSAIGMAVGFLSPKTGDPETDKARVYADTRALIDKFTSRFGSINCAELLKNLKNIDTNPVPEKRTEEYYKVRPCAVFVSEAVRIIEDYAKSLENRG